ncbi:MAG TPA: YhdP family protein [Rhodocyclaceae bacterium]|nr:YhdP family protein [Rhodocyclaceae bacterium]
MDKQELRHGFYYRLRWLWPLLARQAVRRLLGVVGWALVAAYFAFAGLILALRYAVLPNIGQYQATIEQTVGQAIGLPVSIGRIEAGWDGLKPHLTLSDVVVSDRQGRQAFAFERVDSVLSWQTLWRLEPTLDLLAVEGPTLNVRRDASGRISVAGVEAEGETDPRLMEWVLAQPHIRIRDAIIVWEDALRNAPPLVLEDLQFGLDNRGSRHRFGFSAVPPAHLASRIDLRGEFRGNPAEAMDQVSGRLFLELQYADLAGWRDWVDYPVHLPQGRGALRVWGDWEHGQGHVTTDVALEDLRIRLGQTVPVLDLANMRGRLEARYQADEWDLAGSKVELQSLDGIRISPTDFHLRWRHDAQSGRWSGSATANLLDLDALDRLANYLPMDARSRELLATHQPTGRIADLKASWEAEAGQLNRYALRAGFDGLGVKAAGYVPGASGLSGEVDASDKGGSLKLDSRDAGLDLPAVFPEPHLALGSLKARAAWVVDGKNLDVRLDRVDFSGTDAAGSAKGLYHFGGEGPGTIDLTATLSRADGRAVWRYMPAVVSADARNWLRRGIVEGTASDARLVLKGDLKDFPFRDKGKGQFLVTAKAHGVKIDYAPDWPPIEGISGDMSFGIGMRVEAHQGGILGTRIGPVTVEIPDFEAREQMLLVKGQVTGPTAEFLRFIDLSPVGEKIDNFTEDMRAGGSGRLDLALDMPLQRIPDTRIRGEYQFHNNLVTVLPGLPPVTQVNGRLRFTENSLSAPEITGYVLGGPMRLAVKNEGDRVTVAMGGNANMREVRRHLDLPLLDYVTGGTAWKGEVRVRKKSADFVVESGLAGISSSLPEPLNKTAGSILPLRFEKKNLPDNYYRDGLPRDQIRVTLGKAAEALLVRRQEGEAMVLERGALAVGDALPSLPEKGVAAQVSVPRLDLDFWRQAMAGGGNGNGGGQGGAGAAGLVSHINVKTAAMRLMNRDYANVEMQLRPREGGWQIGLSTKEAAGDIFWREAAGGWVQADFKRLALPSEAKVDSGAREVLDSLPGMDIRVADFALGEKRLGRLELKAHNDAGVWHLDTIGLSNPDGNLKGKGQWSSVGNHRTRLNFELTASDAGKLLDRLGYPGTIRRGTARLSGDLAWEGALTSIHYPTLSGDLTLAAGKGQFAKVDPGIGKLLGLLSLQSLPRRLTLDFRDVFSEGFAFDSIDARLAVRNGIMRTVDDLKIDGPAARILMKGQADLKNETQDMLVTVQPEMGSAVSVGALLMAHPVVGAAAVVANKLLQNPLNKIFSFQYHVTGTWTDPKMEKVGQSVQETAAPAPLPKPEEAKQ